MNRSLEKLAGEEPALGEETGDEADDQPKSFSELLWVSCTPVALCQWFSHRKDHQPPKDRDMDSGDRMTGEPRASLSVMEPGFEEQPAVPSAAPRYELLEYKSAGALKMLETEIEGGSSKNRGRKGGSDEIASITRPF